MVPDKEGDAHADRQLVLDSAFGGDPSDGTSRADAVVEVDEGDAPSFFDSGRSLPP